MDQIVGGDWHGFAATANVAFLLGFSSLLSIINPLGGALIFDSVAKDFAPADRDMMAARVGFYSLLIMFGALWGGTYALHFFGVSIDALRIADASVIPIIPTCNTHAPVTVIGERAADFILQRNMLSGEANMEGRLLA